ncbi:uncharacterized protein ATNIH1004_002290 [Aspergillus tanneri]|uniref:Xylanolytic transcriptional activator regulatory domain-containing protein n=1 Tax=Aspergillus tanneri TaxID=1220188 RepID=A0A5M9MY91_9EURO|nr:uncharacterized protein ATNIH1004_002290 [Aspergillus tanneri]KAA8649619.1 hypothetical protein ATNIH1004_002290 [Aspergillus tanneri]
MRDDTFSQTHLNARFAIDVLPGMIRSVNTSAPITRIKSFNQVAQFERAITAARESPNVTERLRAEPVCGEELIAPLGARFGAAKINNLVSPALIYIQVFFEKFHPTWPFLHRATFDPDHEPALLFQSVMMMGLWLTGKEDARIAATDLHSKLLVSIHQQRDKWEAPSQHNAEPPSSWPMATYQGILLQIIFALLKGNQGLNLQLTHELPTLPLQLLKALVRTCLKRKMFFYPSIVAQFKNTLPDVYIWVGVEEVKRFALSLYKVCRSCRVPDTDASSQGRSLLSLADLQFALPDSDELWHASSDLASRLAEDRSAYRERNSEERWISQTARVLQPHGGFCWF